MSMRITLESKGEDAEMQPRKSRDKYQTGLLNRP